MLYMERLMQVTFYRHRKNMVAQKLNRVTINFYEITILFRGHLQYTINGTPVELSAQDVLFLPPNSLRERKNSELPCEYASIHFLSQSPVELPLKITSAVRSFIPTLILAMDKLREETPLEAENTMQSLVQSLVAFLQNTLMQKDENPVIFGIKKYMRENLHRPLLVEDIANHMYLSCSYCNDVFKKATGVPLLTYFTNMRVEEAKNLLMSDEYTLQEIARQLGFEDYNYFSRVFKKSVGVPPGEYRKKFLI